MAKKGDRVTSFHIMTVLEPKKGFALRYSEIKKAMIDRGWIHGDSSVSNNFKALLAENKIVQIQYRYGIPIMRPDGTWYITIQHAGADDEVIELGKECKDA